MAGVLLVVAILAAISSIRRAARWEAEAEHALAGKAIAEQTADSLVTKSRHLEATADSLSRVAKKVTVKVVEKIVRLPAPPADDTTIIKYTAPRDSVIAEQQVAIDLWQVAYDSLSVSHANLTSAYEVISLSNDSLAAVLMDRPKPGFSIVPDISVFAGGAITPAGPQPAIGIGFSWTL